MSSAAARPSGVARDEVVTDVGVGVLQRSFVDSHEPREGRPPAPPASACDGVALHAARVRGGDELAVLALDRGDTAERPRRRDDDVVPALPESLHGLLAEALLDEQPVRLEAAWIERIDQVLGVEVGRVDRLLKVRAPGRRAGAGRAAPTAPAGRRRACRTRATARRRGERGRARASCAVACAARATTAGPPRARTSARACRAASRATGSRASSGASRRTASRRRGCRTGRRRRGARCRRASAPRRPGAPCRRACGGSAGGPCRGAAPSTLCR